MEQEPNVNDETIRGLMPDFNSFVTKQSNNLMEIYENASMRTFWRALKMFILAMPREVKTLISPKVKALEDEIEVSIADVKSPDLRTKIKNQNEVKNHLLEQGAPKIWGELHDILDDRKYKEIGSIKPRSRSKGKPLGVPS